MRNFLITLITCLTLVACGGAQPAPADDTSTEGDDDKEDVQEFQVSDVDDAKARGATPSKIEPTETEAAVRFFVIDKKKDGPIEGIVIKLEGPDGNTYYTGETDAEGFTEILLPVGKTYNLTYLSLGRRDVAAKVKVADEPNLNLKLTMRYKGYDPPAPAKQDAPPPGFVLKGVEFDSGEAKIKEESFAQLDTVVEYMTHKKSARIEISGHTDNVGNPKANKRLSEKRANAVRDYLVSKGIDPSRIEAVGYGSERPIASNDTEEGRQKNRRIEATEL